MSCEFGPTISTQTSQAGQPLTTTTRMLAEQISRQMPPGFEPEHAQAIIDGGIDERHRTFLINRENNENDVAFQFFHNLVKKNYTQKLWSDTPILVDAALPIVGNNGNNKWRAKTWSGTDGPFEMRNFIETAYMSFKAGVWDTAATVDIGLRLDTDKAWTEIDKENVSVHLRFWYIDGHHDGYVRPNPVWEFEKSVNITPCIEYQGTRLYITDKPGAWKAIEELLDAFKQWLTERGFFQGIEGISLHTLTL